MTYRHRNVVYPGNYYHIYNRGVEKRLIYLDDEDFTVMLSLFKRYLSPEESTDALGRPYDSYYGSVELVAYCLMPNHYHMLLYIHEPDTLQRLMQAIGTAYVGYFNKKYERVGPLFQSRYRSKLIVDDAYYAHITRYIHLNPKQWRTWKYSSLGNYLGDRGSNWLSPTRGLESVDGDYLTFLEDYSRDEREIDDVKRLLLPE